VRTVAAALALLLCCGGSLADAASSSGCFRRSEAVADQALRYTTEVMVMSDTCRNQTYDRFALRNRIELIEFQETMKEHFRRSGRNAQAKLDAFMTHLANESALRTGTQNIGQVCAVAVQFLATADTLSGEGFRHYAENQVKQHDGEYRYCRE
jgi:hypothetical protein